MDNANLVQLILGAPMSRRGFLGTSAAAVASPEKIVINLAACPPATLAQMKAAAPALVAFYKRVGFIPRMLLDAQVKQDLLKRDDLITMQPPNVTKELSELSSAAKNLLETHPAAQTIIDILKGIELRCDEAVEEKEKAEGQDSVSFVANNTGLFAPHVVESARSVLQAEPGANSPDMVRRKITVSRAYGRALSSQSNDERIIAQKTYRKEKWANLEHMIQKSAFPFLEQLGLCCTQTPREIDDEDSRVICTENSEEKTYETSFNIPQTPMGQDLLQGLLGTPLRGRANLKSLADYRSLLETVRKDWDRLSFEPPGEMVQRKFREEAARAEIKALEEMTEDEFMHAHSEHPAVVIALNQGSHVEKIAKERKVRISKQQFS